VFSHLQIYDRRERLIVGALDATLAVAAAVARSFGLDATGRPRRRPADPPRRLLLLRLERIGDLLMTLDAIAAVRALAPAAEIDLACGTWNAGLAAMIPHVDRVVTLDAPWLERHGEGARFGALIRWAGVQWAPRHYDVAINFEGDVRSHLLMSRSRAPVRVGFDMAGGGPLLTHRVRFDPTRHTAANSLALVAAAAPLIAGPDSRAEVPSDPSMRPLLRLPEPALAAAGRVLAAAGPVGSPVIGLHASGGRQVKQWPPERFGQAVGRLAAETGAAVMLTGTSGDRPLVARTREALPRGLRVVDVTGDGNLVDLAALLARCTLYVTGDTGPMHLAAAVGTPVVAVFGPSDPRRYAPLVSRRRIVQIHDTLPCAPCNKIRLPPSHCRGITPACLDGLLPDGVYLAARELWEEATRPGPASEHRP
jgi:ADP-heptose:LPS heptosyltransferase